MAVEAFLDKSLIVKDEAGLAWVAGQCVCAPALEVAELILDVVVEGLAKLDEVICAVMLFTVPHFVESALDFIPVSAPLGVAVTAARIVEGAKTFVESGVAAASLFGDWIGPACKIPEFEFDLTRAFVNMVTSSDDLGVSKGCFKRNKAAPPPPDPSPPKAYPPQVDEPKVDPPKADPPKADPAKPDAPVSAPSGPDVSRPGTDAPAPTTPPDATREPDSATDRSTSESSASACRLLVRRAAARKDGLIERKLGDPMSEEVVCNDATTVHSTITEGPIGSYTLEIPKTCCKDWTQACYHYRSVMSVFTQNTDMVRWTCQATPGSSKDGTATARWGSTAIFPIGGKKDQHWFPWVNGFIPESDSRTGCERDEWPPRFFWPGDAVAAQKKMEQRVRLIPASNNGDAGRTLLKGCVPTMRRKRSRGSKHSSTQSSSRPSTRTPAPGRPWVARPPCSPTSLSIPPAPSSPLSAGTAYQTTRTSTDSRTTRAGPRPWRQRTPASSYSPMTSSTKRDNTPSSRSTRPDTRSSPTSRASSTPWAERRRRQPEILPPFLRLVPPASTQHSMQKGSASSQSPMHTSPSSLACLDPPRAPPVQQPLHPLPLLPRRQPRPRPQHPRLSPPQLPHRHPLRFRQKDEWPLRETAPPRPHHQFSPSLRRRRRRRARLPPLDGGVHEPGEAV